MKIPILVDIERGFRKLKLYIKDRTNKVRKQQEVLFNKNFADTKKMIVFVNFPNNEFCGGIMMMFYFATASRNMKNIHGCDVLHANFFNHEAKYYLSQDNFKNDETIYNMELVMQKAKSLDKLILHVPEMLAADLAKELKKYKKVLKNIPDFQINFLNQNIDVFSPKEEWQSLYEITQNITQTTGFERYTTQEICNKWKIPLYYLPPFHEANNVNDYGKKHYKEKEKLFIYSPDEKPLKAEIIAKLQKELPDFKIQEIKGLTYEEYLKTAQRAMFELTFGEGYDAYFVDASLLGGIGFSVYNERFFPSAKYKDVETVYESYEKILENLADDVKKYIENEDLYNELSEKMDNLNHEFSFKPDKTLKGLEKFYKRIPTFVPEESKND
ncbi:MAG: hypothetical protein K6C94_06890 [Candidatus Gastranaerophilales bacterium]|nr:hypothetical protein [Candidatus Gastranaerophilales bacterium]